jgi:hypothetical protein
MRFTLAKHSADSDIAPMVPNTREQSQLRIIGAWTCPIAFLMDPPI